MLLDQISSFHTMSFIRHYPNHISMRKKTVSFVEEALFFFYFSTLSFSRPVAMSYPSDLLFKGIHLIRIKYQFAKVILTVSLMITDNENFNASFGRVHYWNYNIYYTVH